MASIRQAAQNVLDIAKDGIGWIVLYKKGRGWESTYCYPEYDENTCRLDFTELDDQEMTELREIVEIDPMALIVNSYVMNLGDPETMTRDSLAEALKWQYKLNNSELRDALPEKAEDSADPALTYEEFIDLAKQNYEYCMAHPEEFETFAEVTKYVNHYTEPAHGTCTCGNEVELYDQYYGACQCWKCGRWYNLFGQSLLPPEQWETDPSEEEYW